jgi:hypothetical protein
MGTVTDKPAPPPVAGFCQRLFYAQLDLNLRSGLPMRVVMNGAIVTEERARRIVAAARLNGFLPSAPASAA